MKLGAANATGFDIDRDALENAYENIELNNTKQHIRLVCGGLESLKKIPYDLIVANINRNVLAGLIPDFKFYSHEKTIIIISGLLITDKQFIEKIIADSDLSVTDCREQGEWMGMVLK